MLNYVWLGLLILGIGTALTTDIIDQADNKFRNGDKLPIEIIFDDSTSIQADGAYSGKIKVLANDFNEFYGTVQNDDIFVTSKISVNKSKDIVSVFFKVSDATPEMWKYMAKISGKDDDLLGSFKVREIKTSKIITGDLILEDVAFTKMKDVTNAALDYAGTAVNIALGLIGIMALWLGVMKVAEEAGLIKIIANSVKPLTKFLFPDIPPDHPAMGSIIMNMAANMLGLGNAATPFGLKAMEELQTLNDKKDTATNAMVTFLAVNTAGLTLIPVTAIAIRAASGSSNPAVIIGTSIFGALCATTVGITATKIMEKFPIKKGEYGNWLKSYRKGLLVFISLIAIITLLSVTGLLTVIFSKLSFLNPELFKAVINVISIIAIPGLIFMFIGYGAIKKVKVYEVFVVGAKDGFDVAVRIIPYLVAMLVAIGIFRAGGGMQILIAALEPFTNLIGMPAEALPMAIMRPLSGSGSLGIMAEIIATHGPDSFIGILVSTFFGSTETTFYVLAVYFGSVNIRNTRHALPAGLLADVAGILGAVFIVKLLFG
ncbi:MAG: spore maturation protein [Bacteroidetes bacterium]|nr:spore maturation protein [Bacteroidota bacterium]MBU1115492.1 spore maturation protein [Bacteroidota bacterium]MBU1798169.1 spore maturation protein [Bacteroidota bacterium]